MEFFNKHQSIYTLTIRISVRWFFVLKWKLSVEVRISVGNVKAQHSNHTTNSQRNVVIQYLVAEAVVFVPCRHSFKRQDPVRPRTDIWSVLRREKYFMITLIFCYLSYSSYAKKVTQKVGNVSSSKDSIGLFS